MQQFPEHDEAYYINEIRAGNRAAFDKVFLLYFKKLHAYAYSFVKDQEMAEEMVQNVFFRLWQKKEQLKPDGYLRAFLYRSVYNESISYLRRQKVRSSFAEQYTHELKNEHGNLSEEIAATELEQRIHEAINELPEKCAEIFRMSRMDQLRYQQIADVLHISVKTVENQMGKALKLLRVKLADFLPALLIYLIEKL